MLSLSPAISLILCLMLCIYSLYAEAPVEQDVSEDSSVSPPSSTSAVPEVKTVNSPQPSKKLKPAITIPAQTQSPYPNLVSSEGQEKIPVYKKLLDSPIADIHWTGHNYQTVIVLSEKGHVYRSLDSGRSWTNQLTKLSTHDQSVPIVDAIYVSPVDSDYIFLVGTGKTSWTSKNGGKMFTSTSPTKIQEVHLHPTQKEWVLIESLSAGCSRKQSSHDCYKSVHVSKNFGKKWEEIGKYIAQVGWAPAGHGDDTIYATVHEDISGNQPFGYWNPKVHFVKTENYFQTTERVIERGNRYLFSEGAFLFVAQVKEDNPNEVVLMINQDNATSSVFHQAVIPESLSQHSYTVLDTSEGSVFLHVNHDGPQSKQGNIYISGADGSSYSLSLPFNRRNKDGKCDFERVQGLEGVYIANYLHSYAESASQSSTGSRHVEQRGKRFHGSPRTVISFDKGAVWSYLAPPINDAFGNKIVCEHKDACSLHLHGITDSYGPFYSEANAIGLLMATGTVGTHLHDYQGSVNTYFSRDAGLSWFEVAHGSHIYEFGDHGSILVMANDEAPTNFIVYSSDQGLTWTKVKVSETPIEIENIIIEPSATSESFIIYGWQSESGVLIHIDFADLHERPCIGADAPGTPESDYELWTPNDGRLGGKCLLGRTITYTRRKRERACFNPQEYEIAAYYDHCSCTESDFECDAGYSRNIEGGPCVPVEGFTPISLTESCSGFLHRTKGYRRVAGDSCIGGAEWEPELIPCPSEFMSVHRAGSAVMFLIFFLAAVALMSRVAVKYEFMSYFWNNMKGQFSHVKYSRIISDEFEDDEDFGQPAELFDNDIDHEDSEMGFQLSGTGKSEKHSSGHSSEFSLPVPKRISSDVPAINPPPNDL